MRVVRGFDKAKALLSRSVPFDAIDVPTEITQRIQQVFGRPLTPVGAVRQILQEVRARGDAALREYTRRIDGFELASVEVPRERFAAAHEKVSSELMDALQLAAQRIREFHTTSLSRGWVDFRRGLGELVVPLERVGLYAPGGTAAYPSTVLMGAIPAKVAGVRDVVLCTPSSDGKEPHPATLVAADLAGVDRLFQLGGAQAVAAMAYGTESVPRVDKVCGPGNLFVALAKREVYGQVDIDGLYGPTETLLIADDSANPAWCAADLLAQAEHDVIAHPVLVTTSPALAQAVAAAVDSQLATLERRDIARASLERHGLIALVDSLEEAFALANDFAPEHLCLLLRDPWSHLDKVRHAGGVFVGEHSPEVMGDYVAGPSHTMPTGGTARFASYLGVHHFMRPMLVVGLDRATFNRLAPAASTIARAEGLIGHARAVEVRMDQTL